MLEPILGSSIREKVLLYIYVNGEGFAREIARNTGAPLDSVQKQLLRLFEGGVLSRTRRGRTVSYSFNQEFRFYRTLMNLLADLSAAAGMKRITHEPKRYSTRRME